VLENKYYMDWINENILAAAIRRLGMGLWKGGDVAVIDGAVNGSASLVGAFSSVVRTLQTGYLSWYALFMVLGLFGLMTWQLWPYLMSLIVH
jgi:NADH-quinone oxidoreductase subunit L